MESRGLKLERAGFVALMRMDRPERLNALDAALVHALHTTMDELAEDDEVRVVILTGEGRGFCSGADVAALQARVESAGEGEGADMSVASWLKGRSMADLAIHIRGLPQPVLCAVNGIAAGAGIALALACDIRIASDQARFSSLFIKRSLTPDTGVSQMLPQLVGPGVAAEMALTGNIYDAQWAFQMGLVNKVVPHDQLLAETRAMADTIAANPPAAARATKRLLYRGLLYDLQQGVNNESYYNSLLRRTEDSREAIYAFLEKRTPVFKGR